MKIVDDTEETDEQMYTMVGGFFTEGMRWDIYRERWLAGKIDELRAWIVKNKVRVYGEYMEERHIEFDDGERWAFTYRAWGDLMAAVWSTEEDKDYHYMDFYMEQTL